MNIKIACICVCVVVIILPQFCFADAVANKLVFKESVDLLKQGKSTEAITKAMTIDDLELRKNILIEINNESASKFWSNFGVGLLIDFDLGNRKPVKSASVINNKVVVSEEDDTKFGLGLEVHKFMTGSAFGGEQTGLWTGSWAVGPYVSVLPGTNQVIDALGAGIIFGFFGAPNKNPDGTASKGGVSMNILIGGYVDPQTQVLADGFKDGEALPTGETSLRFKNVTQYGFQGGLSFNYGF